MEVKDKIFKNSEDIIDNILYEGKLFIKERQVSYHKNYRCKNQRKNEHLKNANFCNALIKKKKDKKKYILYIRKKS